MAARAGRFPGDLLAGDRAIFLAGKCFGARFWISRGPLAGRRGTMERGDPLPAVGKVGQPRVRRATVCILSAAVVDTGGGARIWGSLECRAGSLHRHGQANGGSDVVLRLSELLV